MSSRPTYSAPPPFYWKPQVPEKDYMSENYRRIRQIANQTQKKRSEPLKAAFIPGVTKNEKYAHVSSKVGEFLKQPKKESSDSDREVAATIQQQKRQLQRNTAKEKQPISRRLSRSSIDLRANNSNQTAAAASHSATSIPAGRLNNSSLQLRGRRASGESFNAPSESVYNWHFKDDVIQPATVVNGYANGARFSNGCQNSSTPLQYCHRVEYLPCDGICADEEIQPDSARSGSSCRTSRGCNTEETRILDDPLKCYSVVNRQGDTFDGPSMANVTQQSQLPKSRSVLTLPSGVNNEGRSYVNRGWPQPNTLDNQTSYLGSRLNSMKVSEAERTENNGVKTHLKPTKSQASGVGPGGDFPHTLGAVPKYLKQRQEEWKTQEKEKRDAEMNANVPHGYVLLSDDERLEHLKTFKKNYDALINDLNRIPIRIDTIRVKEHKVQLEQQLTRLEEAMKTFSRPRVWVKVDG